MRDKFDRFSLRLFWILGVLAGATVALASQGGCMNTLRGAGMDLSGMWNGMTETYNRGIQPAPAH